MIWQVGKGRRMRLTPGQKITFVIAGVIIVALPAWVLGGTYLKDRNAALALSRSWTIEGRPCPTLSAAAFAERGFKAPKSVDYSGVVVSRQFGHIACSALRYGQAWGLSEYVVCQFTSPNVIKVETRKGEWYFAPGMGQPATISTPQDEARCVLASNFTLNPRRE